MRSLLLSILLCSSVAACGGKEAAPRSGEGEQAQAKPADAGAREAPVDGPGDEVDLEAAMTAFGCNTPGDAAAKRACEGIGLFANGQRMQSFPNSGTAVHLARRECSKDPHGMIHFSIAKLSPGGGLEEQFEAWPREPAKELTADRIMGDLQRGGEPSEPSPAESPDGYAPKTLAGMKATWEMVPAVKVELDQGSGESLRERPEGPSAGVGYWREASGKLVRVVPPAGEFGWCVNVYYAVPE